MESKEIRLRIAEALIPVCTKFDITKCSMIKHFEEVENYVMGEPESKPKEEPKKPVGKFRKKKEGILDH